MAYMNFEQFAERFDITLDASPIANRTDRSSNDWDASALHFQVALKMQGRPIWQGQYSMGIGHAEAWAKANPRRARAHGWKPLPKGKRWLTPAAEHAKLIKAASKHIRPEVEDVLCSLHCDAADSDQPFEDWAEYLGFDSDSIRAKAMWEACNDTRRALKAGMGRAWPVFADQTMDGEEDAEENDIHDRFKAEVLPHAVAEFGPDDEIAIREAFNDWTDSLCKGGDMTEWLYENICHPDLSERDLIEAMAARA